MGPAIGLALFAGFMTLLAVGRFAFQRDAERRVRDWARAGGYTLERFERAPSLVAGPRPTWLVRVVDADGARREAWVKTGGSVKEPVDVLWAAPGSSVFR